MLPKAENLICILTNVPYVSTDTVLTYAHETCGKNAVARQAVTLTLTSDHCLALHDVVTFCAFALHPFE